MNTAIGDAQPARPATGVWFVVLVGLSVACSAFLPSAFFDLWRRLVMLLAIGLGSVTGVSVAARGDILTVNGFAMQVINECTAVNYVIIIATAILCYVRHPLRYRLAGIAVAVPAIVLANAFRLVITGITGSISRNAFDFVHEYLWVALFALFIFAIWKIWADRRLRLTRGALIRTGAVVAVCSAVFALHLSIMDAYGPFLARFSSLFAPLFSHDATGIVWVRDRFLVNGGAVPLKIPFSPEYFNIAVLIGMVFPLQRKPGWKYLWLCLFAAAALLLLNAVLIANSAAILLKHGQASFNIYLLIEKGLLLAVPFALWWIVAGPGEKRIDNEQTVK